MPHEITVKDVETSNDLQVFTTFSVDRHPGITVVWKVGSGTLNLMRTAGPNGAYKMTTKRHTSYKTAEGAIAGAEKLFKLLDKTYVTQDEPE